MPFDTHIIAAAGLGIALSACCGFRVFIPMLIAGLAGRFDWFHLSNQFSMLSGTPALIALGVASLVEIAAYYIPFVDNILDTISTPLSVAAGGVIASSVFPIENEWIRWIMGFLAGGGGAGIVSAGTGILRLFSSKLTLGTGNSAVATSENAAAIGGSFLSFLIPIAMAIIAILLFGYILNVLYRRAKKLTIMQKRNSESSLHR